MPRERKDVSVARHAIRAALSGNANEPGVDAAESVAAVTEATDEASYVEPKELLSAADRYFTELRQKEQRVFREARRKISEMKRLNARGGDSQGFKFVLPRSVKSYARTLQGEDLFGPVAAPLQHTYENDDPIADFNNDDSAKPMHRKKRKSKTFSDFYQFQVWEKWTHNAENFLKRGTAAKRLFAEKGTPAATPARKRSIRKL